MIPLNDMFSNLLSPYSQVLTIREMLEFDHNKTLIIYKKPLWRCYSCRKKTQGFCIYKYKQLKITHYLEISMNHMFLMAVLDSRYNLKIWWKKINTSFTWQQTDLPNNFVFQIWIFLNNKMHPTPVHTNYKPHSLLLLTSRNEMHGIKRLSLSFLHKY